MNLNKLARTITIRESGKKEVSIAQVKEIMKLIFEELALYKPSEVLKTIERYE